MLEKGTRFHRMMQDWVRALRARMSISQCQLAKLVGVRSEAVSYWERSERHPNGASQAMLLALATDEERRQFLEVAAGLLKDTLLDEAGEPLRCADCGRLLRVHDYSQRGLPAPQGLTSPHSRWLRCVDCVLGPGGAGGG